MKKAKTILTFVLSLLALICLTTPAIGAGRLPDLTVDRLELSNDCQIKVTIKNIGSVGIPDAAYDRSKGVIIQASTSSEGWGGYLLFILDTTRALQKPGGSFSFTGFKRPLNPGEMLSLKMSILDPFNTTPDGNPGNNVKVARLGCSQDKPDLKVHFTAPSMITPGTDIGSQIKLKVWNAGNAPAAGTLSAGNNGYMVDLVLSTDTMVPPTFAPYSSTFSEDVLVKGGRVSRTRNLNPGQTQFYPVGAGIPADVPPNGCYLCAFVDPGTKIDESDENNNVYCQRIVFKETPASDERKPDLGMYGFLKIGEKKKLVKWNETIVLTPDDAFLVSGGKPAFNLYYSYREYENVASGGPFKNKLFFNGNLVSQQTNLTLAPRQIKDVHTQAYLGPQNGKLQIKVDADNDVAETREDNNFGFFVNIVFRGF